MKNESARSSATGTKAFCKKKVSDSSDIGNMDEAIHYAFKLTDTYGIMRINKAILEASIEYQVDETQLREQINNASFMLNERKTNE